MSIWQKSKTFSSTSHLVDFDFSILIYSYPSRSNSSRTKSSFTRKSKYEKAEEMTNFTQVTSSKNEFLSFFHLVSRSGWFCKIHTLYFSGFCRYNETWQIVQTQYFTNYNLNPWQSWASQFITEVISFYCNYWYIF